MRSPLLLIATMFVASCASSSDSSERGEYTVSAGLGAPPPGDERTFSCPRSLSDCRRMAEEYCGDAGYRRVRTQRNIREDMAETGVPMLGGQTGAHSQSGTLSESQMRGRTAIGDDPNRSMTVRCREQEERDEASSEQSE